MVNRSKKRCKKIAGKALRNGLQRMNTNNISKISNRLSKKKRCNKNRKNKVKQIYVEKKFSDDYMKSKEGEYFDNKDYDMIIKDDCDVYYFDENGNKQTLIKFRKNVFPEKLCNIGIDCLKEAAKKTHDNRGAAAGVIDLKKMPSYANLENQLIGKNKFRVKAYISRHTGKLVTNSLGNISQSNIIGYYDKRDRNLGPNCSSM
jgi:hypothetical protein